MWPARDVLSFDREVQVWPWHLTGPRVAHLTAPQLQCCCELTGFLVPAGQTFSFLCAGSEILPELCCGVSVWPLAARPHAVPSCFVQASRPVVTSTLTLTHLCSFAHLLCEVLQKPSFSEGVRVFATFLLVSSANFGVLFSNW